MSEEIIELLKELKCGVTVCVIFLFFILILFIGYFFGCALEESQKQKEQLEKQKQASLKEDIVKEITDYYDKTKEGK